MIAAATLASRHTPTLGRPSADLARRVGEYAKPRPDTTGDLAVSSPSSGAVAGIFQGYVSGGPLIATAAIISAYTGVTVGRSTGSFAAGVGAGLAVGGGVGMLAQASLATLSHVPVAGTALAGAGLVGAFAGAVGALSGSRCAATRDGVYGGMLSGAVAGAALGVPGLALAGALGAGIGATAPTKVGRVALGAVAGAASGALSGVLGGVGAMATAALVGAGVGAMGAVLGPVARQVQRNLTADLTQAIYRRVDPYVAKHPLTKVQKVGLGSFAGALSLAPVGGLFGLPGLAVAAGAGAIAGGVWALRRQRAVAGTPQTNSATP